MLVTGITAIVISALLLSIEGAHIIVLPFSALVLIIYSIKRFNLRKYVVIPTIFVTAIIVTLSLFTFNKVNVTPYLKYNKTENNICGKVISNPANVNGNLTFNIKTDKIGHNKSNATVTVKIPYCENAEIELYDYINIKDAFISVATNNTEDYSLSDISDDVFLYASTDNYEVLHQCTKTPYYYCLSLKKLISDSITSHTNEEPGGLLKGMIFGDTSSITPKVFKAFRNSGIAHLLAVSGLHTSLWCGLIIAILSSFKISEKVSSFICFAFLILFCIISGFTPSVIRASIMMAIILTAPFFKRLSDGINSLGLAVTLLLLCNPYIVLSISFQLSASATLGVLVARNFYPHITRLTNKINYVPLKASLTALIKSVLISCLAGLFTLPASSYYFGTLCTVAPVTNILCVQLAFYGMVIGTISTFLSLVNIPLLKSITIFLFNITEFILNIVIDLSEALSKLKFATIPINSTFLFISISAGALIFTSGYIFYKRKGNKKLLKLTALITAIEMIVITFIPLYSPRLKNTVTITNCGNGIQIVIRSGTKYAYIENTNMLITANTKNALPVATCESLQFYIPTYLTAESLNNIKTISENYSPQTTVMPRKLNIFAKKNNIELPHGTLLSEQGKFTLSSEITFEIVDTTNIKYVIIKCNEKTVLVHLHGETHFYKHIDDSTCYVAVYNSTIPDVVPKNASEIILSSDEKIDRVKLADFISHVNVPVHVTSINGNAVIYF